MKIKYQRVDNDYNVGLEVYDDTFYNNEITYTYRGTRGTANHLVVHSILKGDIVIIENEHNIDLSECEESILKEYAIRLNEDSIPSHIFKIQDKMLVKENGKLKIVDTK